MAGDISGRHGRLNISRPFYNISVEFRDPHLPLRDFFKGASVVLYCGNNESAVQPFLCAPLSEDVRYRDTLERPFSFMAPPSFSTAENVQNGTTSSLVISHVSGGHPQLGSVKFGPDPELHVDLNFTSVRHILESSGESCAARGTKLRMHIHEGWMGMQASQSYGFGADVCGIRYDSIRQHDRDGRHLGHFFLVPR